MLTSLRSGISVKASPLANDKHGRHKDSRNSCKKAANTCSLNQVWAHEKSSMPSVWLKPSSDIKLCRETETQPEEERPPLPDGRDGLARSFVHIANQCPVNGKRSAKRLAFGAWFLSGEWFYSLGHLSRCRWSVDRRGAQEIAYRRTELAVG